MSIIQNFRYFNKFFVLIIITCLLHVFIVSCDTSEAAETEYLTRANNSNDTNGVKSST